MEKITVTWELEDGYVGETRPQTITVDVQKHIMSEEQWSSLSENEKKDIIEEQVLYDFEQKIGYYITDYGI